MSFRFGILIFLLATPVLRANPVFQGLRDAASVFAPVAAEKSAAIRSTAAEMFARHTKVKNGNHLSK